RIAGATAVRRILVVEDDEVEAGLLRRHLEGASYSVETAANGREALAALKSRPADLVTLDLLMPEMDGFSLLAELRSDPTFSDLPVIVVTARDLSADE